MLDYLLSCFYSFLACIGFCIIFNIRNKLILYASIGGALGWFVYLLLNPLNSVISQSFIAVMTITFYSEIMARVHKVPATTFLIAGLIPLVPGGGIYYTMEYFIQGQTSNFLNSAIETFAIAGSLSFGILIISSIMRLLSPFIR